MLMVGEDQKVDTLAGVVLHTAATCTECSTAISFGISVREFSRSFECPVCKKGYNLAMTKEANGLDYRILCEEQHDVRIG